jgi:cysteine-rich repeat protein
MNFAQVCGVVTCAVTAFVGCGDDRDTTSTRDEAPAHQAGGGDPRSAPPGAWQATAISAATTMGTPATIDLIADPHAAQTGERVVTGYSQPAHGRVTLIGPRAIYSPTPGYTGSDSFRYTVTGADGQTSPATAEVVVAATSPFCAITIAGPSSAMIGPAIHLTATASCNISTPEIQWQHRFGTITTFSTFKSFSTATSADFTTTGQALGTHQFRARVRAQGTTTIFLSNTLTTSLIANTSTCTAVTLDTPAAGAVFAVGQAIALHATATCPAGVVPEFQYLAMQPSDTGFTALPGAFPGGSSYTPPQPGSWVLAAAVRASGSTGPFQLQSAAVTVSVSHAPTAVDDTLALDEDTTGTINALANDSDPDGDPLTAAITTPPAAGTASISAGVVTYHPAANYNGSDAIGYTVDDGHGNTATATIHITVNPVEDPPSAQHDFLTVAEDTSGALDVAANDTDPDGDALTVVGFSQPSHGTAAFTGNVATYTPAANYTGSDELEYTIDDGHGGTSTASVFVTVVAGNDAPVAADDTLITPEDTAGGVNLLGNDRDPDGDSLTVVGFSQPLHGTVSVVLGLALYAPAADYNGPDAFTYTVADPSGATASATVHVTVLPVNDPPVAADDRASLDEDATATIDVVANDGDVDGDVLAIASVTQPAHGAVAIVSGHEVTYTPAADYNGADSFTYTVADPSGASATASVTLAIAAVNDPPVAVADEVSVDEDTAGTIDVVANDRDVDGDALAITAIAQPAHGTAAIVDATHVSYTPAADYSGPDAFSYTISDGHGGEAGAAVSVTVNPVNDPPVAVADAAALDEDTAATIDAAANDSDIDGDALAVTAVTQPAHGTAAIVDATHVSYTPAADYNGPDAFSYTISDPSGATATAAVTVAVNPVDDAPIAVADAASALEDGGVTIDAAANDSDVDGDPLTIVAVTQPAHGSASIVDAHHVAYTPAPLFHGSDAFSYTIGDPSGATATAVVTVAVVHVNHAPVAVDDAAGLDEDTAVTVDVVGNDLDVDGDALTIAAITQPAHGVALALDGHRVQYVPAPDYNGPDALSYTISDGAGGESTAQLVLAVAPVNDPPVAIADAVTLDEDTSATLDVVANDSDIDGDGLAIAAVTQPVHGAASIVDAHHVRYTPAPNYHGPDGFSYTIADPAGATATAAVAVTVSSVNDPPVAVDDAASLDEDTAVTVDVVGNDLDVDGDPLTIAAVTQPAHGVALALDGHRVQYVPAPNYNGPDALSYTISDGNGGQSTAQLALTVNPVNDAPVAVADAITLDEDTSATLDVVANDSDVDGDTLAVASVTQPAHGSAAITGLHQVSYTPAPDYNGADSFSYTIDDGHGGQATAQVAVAVNPVNDAPVAAADAATLDEDTAATVDVVANDSDVDGDALTVTAVTQPAHGTAAVVDEHHVRYTPAADYNGADSFSYTIIDGHGGDATAQVAVTVNPVNDPPVAATGALDTFDDTPATATLTGSDVDGDALTFAIATPPAHGTLGPVAGNHVTYTPAAGYAGADAFTFTAFDGHVSSAPATLQVTVTRSVCGNGIREGVHEECDDGNATPGDGCEATCRLTCGSDTGADRDAVDPATGRCFVAYDGVQHSYQDAAAMCVALGGHLPTITSAGEDAAAFAAVRAGDTPWLGGDDIAVEGAFGWLTGEPFGYSDFHAGKPDNAGDADCLQYLADGTWSDAACATGSATGTLCELELAQPTPAFATGGGGTRALAVADLNGDGHADIAAINPANNTVGVLLGDGAGGFAAPVTYATGTGPAAIAAGDFDGDGRIDLAVVNATAGTVGILRGTGGGAFTAGASIAIAAGATAIAAGDLDGDGNLDLAIAASGTVQLLHGNGSGGFSALGSVVVTGAPAAITIGDFNHDGKPDLALTTPAAVLVVTATGLGVFGLPVTLATVTGARGIAARDLDGDGNVDLAVATSAGVSVWFGGTLGLGSVVNLTAAGAQFVAAGDFDGDGSVDLAAVTGNFATLFHRAGRSFTQAGPLVTTGGGGASFVAAASLNGDAADDLVVANATTSTAGIVLGGTGGLVGARALPAGTGSTATVSGDFNEDGRADLAVIDPPTAKVYLFLQNAAGALVPGATLSLAAGANPTYGIAADLNGDGHVDLAVVNVAFSTVSVLLGTGTGTFGTPLNASVGSQPRRLAVADLNGDGLLDLAVPNATAVAILINTGGGRFGRLADVPAGTGPAAVVAGDFNGDGKKDLAVATTGEASVKLALGHGDGTFAAATAFPVASAGQAIAAGDLDGDGKLDIAVTGTTANSVSILRGTGTGSFAAATSVAVGAQPSSVVAVDLDGDGRLDLVVGNAGTGDVTVLHGGAGGSFGASSFAVGGPVGWVCVADFDRDGHLDIAAAAAGPIAALLYSGR